MSWSIWDVDSNDHIRLDRQLRDIGLLGIPIHEVPVIFV